MNKILNIFENRELLKESLINDICFFLSTYDDSLGYPLLPEELLKKYADNELFEQSILSLQSDGLVKVRSFVGKSIGHVRITKKIIYQYKESLNYDLEKNINKVISYLANEFNNNPTAWGNRVKIKELFNLQELESLFIIEEIDELGGIDQFSNAMSGVEKKQFLISFKIIDLAIKKDEEIFRKLDKHKISVEKLESGEVNKEIIKIFDLYGIKKETIPILIECLKIQAKSSVGRDLSASALKAGLGSIPGAGAVLTEIVSFVQIADDELSKVIVRDKLSKLDNKE